MLRCPTAVRTLRNLMEVQSQQKVHFHYNHTDSCNFSRWTASSVRVSLHTPRLNPRDMCHIPPATLSNKARTYGKKSRSVCFCWELNLRPHGALSNFIDLIAIVSP
ncbi:hypothetical protein T459_19527 [Capsicum annuum]|uniref:Uncharacterized protein n=1 Tax=Capsicum annuum TaxID=4072 RepID=A0A2G2Z2B8_CAPAN|nr:hypothetical protein T459_19527 [Capsicum annuum]